MDDTPRKDGWLPRLARRMFGPGRWYFTAAEFLGIAGMLCTASDVYGRFSAWKKIPPIDNLNHFLWIFGLWTWGIFALVIVIWKKTYTDMKESDRELIEARRELSTRTEELQSTRNLVVESAKIQHHVAEEVRKCAKLRKDFVCCRDLQQIFRQLQEYIQARLGQKKVSITVKVFEPGRKQLCAVFRDDGQVQRGSGDDSTGPELSYAYRAFSGEQEIPEPRQWALARDVERLPPSEEPYKVRARMFKFRSVLAFPLRYPTVAAEFSGAALGPIKCTKLFGFLSFDAHDENTFDALFTGPRRSAEWDNEGTNLQLGIDSNLYYGVADSVATILMLSEKVPMHTTEKNHG